ncbi:MAG: CBS domain-containing protein [Methanocalculus sp. MSAO_Arc1]|uniref:CBS domain-containing protein n=1 Tax=Methanocalculus TaxID=71151 RepID=UPI000FED7012|nr:MULTISPECIES: CBS domain-containing protein [unclassified Methanocalculus]MCP1662233.1 CBS domain-containing protein [Methanocalculus sp. AMF5]RQD81688.1 MAG: CBS domain-containing protein [Methanocalculus sp. MSAO_Arc1]
MKVARDLMIEVTTLQADEYVTRARQILRDDVHREIFITDSDNQLEGKITITDVLRVMDTRSNVTIAGFISHAAAVPMEAPLEDVASAILASEADSAAVVNAKNECIGAILLRDLFPILVSRHEIKGRVLDVMTEQVICSDADDSIQKVYATILDSGYASLPIVSKKEIVGIISRRDLVENGRIRHSIGNSKKIPINRVMNTPVITTGPDAMVSDAANLMITHDISRMPVVRDRVIVGILDRHDVLKTLVKKA